MCLWRRSFTASCEDRKFPEMIMKDRDVSYIFGLTNKCDRLEALRLATVALAYYLN